MIFSFVPSPIFNLALFTTINPLKLRQHLPIICGVVTRFADGALLESRGLPLNFAAARTTDAGLVDHLLDF